MQLFLPWQIESTPEIKYARLCNMNERHLYNMRCFLESYFHNVYDSFVELIHYD